jgi:pilus assembly protein CpaE
MEFPGKSFLQAREQEVPAMPTRVGLVDGAVAATDLAMLVHQFPAAHFEPVGAQWPEQYPNRLNILMVGVDGAVAGQVESAIRRLAARPASLLVLVTLRNADVSTSRALARAGAADVLPVPASEAALALCLERLLSRETPHHGAGRKTGQVVALLKAGGGTGATSLGVQAAQLLAGRAGQANRVAFADLDLQFGSAALYFDLNEALTVADCIAVGENLRETQFATALAPHKSGVRVLAGPKELMPLEMLTPQLAETLVGSLKRDFALTILDLPSAWTAWTNSALRMADRIVLVTQLSVPHVHLVRRQLDVLARQQLNNLPLTLVCNGITSDRHGLLALKSAEGAIGRAFDVQVPEDVRLMGAATNQGLALSAVKRGSKLEKAVTLVAEAIAADALAVAQKSR